MKARISRIGWPRAEGRLTDPTGADIVTTPPHP
jgi:hypothetical protein